jgi:Beta-lactamase.
MHLEGEKGGSTLLKPGSFKVLHTPPFDTGVGYALGWFVNRGGPWTDEMMLTHTGSNGLNGAKVWMLLESDFAVLVTTNIGSPSASSACDDAFSILISKFLPAK